jgi:hypothetical protein
MVPLVLPAPPPVTVPADDVKTEVLLLAKYTLYVVPVLTPWLKLADGVTHGVLQSAGLFTRIEELHPPPAAVAVISTFVPTGTLMTELPLTTPALTVMVLPGSALNVTL